MERASIPDTGASVSQWKTNNQPSSNEIPLSFAYSTKRSSETSGPGCRKNLTFSPYCSGTSASLWLQRRPSPPLGYDAVRFTYPPDMHPLALTKVHHEIAIVRGRHLLQMLICNQPSEEIWTGVHKAQSVTRDFRIFFAALEEKGMHPTCVLIFGEVVTEYPYCVWNFFGYRLQLNAMLIRLVTTLGHRSQFLAERLHSIIILQKHK